MRAWTAARSAAAAFAFYLALAVVATWPLAARPTDHTLGHVALESTPRLNAWAMSTVRHNLLHDPAHLFDGNAFHPYRRTLAFSEHLFVPALLGAPVALASGNDVLAYNAVLLFTLALAALGAFLLARALGIAPAAALLAGVVYAFHTWNINEVVRLQILSNAWFPFLLRALLRFFDRPAPRAAAAVGALYALQSLSCMYWALYLPMLVGPAAVYLQWRYRRPARDLVRLGAALLPAVAVTALFFEPYVRTARELGLQRPEPQSLDLGRYFDVLPGNLLYEGWLGTAGRNQNAAHFLGFVVLVLAVYGAARGTLGAGPARFKTFVLALAAAGFFLSLGPEIRLNDRIFAGGPYAVLYDGLPGFRNVRYPERFCILLSLALAPLAASGLALLRPHLGRPGTLFVVAVAFVEHLSLPHVLTPMPTGEQVPAVYRWVGETPEIRAVAEVPSSRHRMERLDALPMWLSTFHWKRTLQGFTGYFPPTYNFSKWRLYHFPSPDSVTFLERFGIDTVIVRAEQGVLPAWLGPDARWQVHGPFPGGDAAVRLENAGANPFPPPGGGDPSLIEIPRDGWDVQATYPGAARAIDGNPATAWMTLDRQGRGDFYRITFREPVEVARIAVGVRDPYEFPVRVKVMGQTDDDWTELPYDEKAAYDGLFGMLLHRPRDAWLHLDVTPRRVRSVRIRITETDPFWMLWNMAEIRVFRRAVPSL